MGTRGTTGFIVNGKRVSQYQQYDSYLDGVGLDVLKFARRLGADTFALDAARKGAAKLKIVPQDGEPTPQEKLAMADTFEQVSTGNDYYAWLRKTQGQPELILASGYIVDAGGSFQNEEYDYVLDLDNRNLIVYAYGEKIGTFNFDSLPTDEEFVKTPIPE